MKIYAMTATFGKLENQTLHLQPDLNVIHAPNEWGKTTWCAFLTTMLYGLDTREKTTKTNLAVKERYAPWSGSPMAGRVELDWNGRDITIERWTKGRTPLGEFRAYETQSGLEIPELNGANCGQMLLGVEKSVFMRAGFLRLSDLPVTEDESLRRRLNALVTTGDESNAGDLLAQKLKALKNKCKSNSVTGLIPQAEAEKRGLEEKLSELQSLQNQMESIRGHQQLLQTQRNALRNHQQALQYAAAQENQERLKQADQQAAAAAERYAKLEALCAELPPRETARAQLNQLASLQQQLQQALQEANQLPPEPVISQTPQRFAGMTAQEAMASAQRDAAAARTLEDGKKKTATQKMHMLLGLGGVLLLMGALFLFGQFLFGAVMGGLGLMLMVTLWICWRVKCRQLEEQLAAIYSHYPYPNPQRWVEEAEFYAESLQQYQAAAEKLRMQRQASQARIAGLEQQCAALLGGQDVESWQYAQNQAITLQDACAAACRDHQLAQAHAEALQAVVRAVEKPHQEDTLHHSEEETRRLLADTEQAQRQLQNRLGQCQGRMDALGLESELKAQLDAVNQRLARLRETYTALELALHTLEDATAQLQRRYAPRIAQQAQELFHRLTGGRYDRLQLQQDLSVNAGAAGETVVRSAQWRSEGTIDQLYLALRLAVARELTPNAPFILDDALVRFDDTRHAAAMEILRQEAENRQIILFTCQSRENA